jgi:hypothetical protein
MLTDRAAISCSLSLSFFFLYMSRLARLLVKSTQALFNQISQKASLLFFSSYIYDDDHNHHDVDE